MDQALEASQIQKFLEAFALICRVRPDIIMFTLGIQQVSEHLAIVGTGTGHDMSSNGNMLNIDADVVFVAIVVDPILIIPIERPSLSGTSDLDFSPSPQASARL
jgi:hypothetical protein